MLQQYWGDERGKKESKNISFWSDEHKGELRRNIEPRDVCGVLHPDNGTNVTLLGEPQRAHNR